jgi:hypothetical protein
MNTMMMCKNINLNSWDKNLKLKLNKYSFFKKKLIRRELKVIMIKNKEHIKQNKIKNNKI